jgi:hypothetical protein
MRFSRRRWLLAGLCAVLAVTGVAESVVARAEVSAAAGTNATSNLAGWWLAIDPLFPTMWDKAGLRAMEELLIIDEGGDVDDRAMQFFLPDAEFCTATKNPFCSDAPVVARARLSVSDGHLKVSGKVDGKASVFFPDPELDRLYRRTVVTGTPSWSMLRSADGRVLTLRSDYSALTRTLVKVDPDKLRRLRAGFLAMVVSALKHWRCFLANATANDHAFDAIRSGGNAAPDVLPDFLKAASYIASLDDAASRSVPDDSDPEQRKLAGAPLERIMLERFPDIRIPSTASRRDALRARLKPLQARLAGQPTQVTSPLDDAELAALAWSHKRNADVGRLFCLK